jgi:hypothetical protein
LAGDPSCYPQPNTQGAANGVWLHSVYDGSSDAAGLLISSFVRFSVASKRRRK